MESRRDRRAWTPAALLDLALHMARQGPGGAAAAPRHLSVTARRLVMFAGRLAAHCHGGTREQYGELIAAARDVHDLDSDLRQFICAEWDGQHLRGRSADGIALIVCGAHPDVQVEDPSHDLNGYTLLHFFSEHSIYFTDRRPHNNVQTLRIRALLRLGASPDVRDAKGRTPLFNHLFRGGTRLVDVVRFLLQYGADPNAVVCDGETVLTYRHCFDGTDILIPHEDGAFSAEIIRELVRAGADVNATSPAGKTALMVQMEASEWCPAVTRELLAAPSCDVSAVDSDGRTALQRAESVRAALDAPNERLEECIRLLKAAAAAVR